MSPPDFLLPNPETVYDLGVLFREEGKLREARDAFLQAADTFRAIHGSPSVDMGAHEARALLAAGAVCGEMGAIAKGHELALEAVTVLLPAFEHRPILNWKLMLETCRYYIGYCEQLGVEEDHSVIKRVDDVLNRGR